jgi:hypothetical protein
VGLTANLDAVEKGETSPIAGNRIPIPRSSTYSLATIPIEVWYVSGWSKIKGLCVSVIELSVGTSEGC